jgi:hypothetical protein
MERPQVRFKLLLVQKYSSLLICCLWLIFCLIENQVPTDIGDGIQHYFIAEASWSNPMLFLDHWGKPLFTLLASPFAQFGFIGMGIFQVIVFFSTIVLAWKCSRKLEVKPILELIFPFILLLTYDYTSTILGGLTEPLFNLFLMLAAYLLLQKKWVWFGIVVSFLPFLRSEGQFVVLLGIIILASFKAYKQLPWFGLGFLLYAVVGEIVLDDFFWYFSQSPYEISNGIYGNGSWFHYLISYKNYLGNFGLFVFLLALFGIIFIRIKYKQFLELNWSFIGFGSIVYMTILLVHSYLWATGQGGSAGLTRIATQGMPLFVLLNLYIISHSFKVRISSLVQSALSFVILFGLGVKLISSKYFPTRSNENEHCILQTAEFVKKNMSHSANIYYFHPLFAFQMGGNPYKKDSRFKVYYCEDLKQDIALRFKDGDIIVRDSWFGPQESSFPILDIQNSPELNPIGNFPSLLQVDDRFNEEEGLRVYRVQKK